MENRRKVFHIEIGIFLMLLLVSLRFEYVVLIVLASVFLGLVILNKKLLGGSVPIADEMLIVFGREGESPAHGAFWYAFGVLLIFSFVQDFNGILASVFILGVSDGLSTIVGIHGKHKLPYNKKKSLEGTAGFAFVSLVTYFLIGPIAILFSLLGAFFESIDLKLDDNLIISIFSCVFFFVF